ncbi:D-lyxose/D-mannose family sugar isomerase [Celeribacter litoreus]|uniref:D-lyxose/D-mannose family sugar isomerase n=1 Tax=Celeribacter litoreus TaxID=2876714 RepID=UPI001CCDFA28|nr:D-lyxose/D-mannose family sugar isomerase [Celeribacter litoreus]MCA0043644.1 D-lyxose/D-mannose family sugar isomerase [Celeribacter litoreus]
MKRSTINEIIRESDAFMKSFGFTLPPFAYLSPEQLQAHVVENSPMIRDHMLGWDITDYGQGDFENLGLFLFTVRNGSAANVAQGMGPLYAEKLLISEENQISPMHHHIKKTEDIINRGGATLVLELWTRGDEGGLDPNAPVEVMTDGQKRVLKAGEHLALAPGESVTLEPWHWHAFWGEGGRALIGEVSNVNDDRTDNIFRDPIGRFSTIEEDTAPLHLLVSDYDAWLA